MWEFLRRQKSSNKIHLGEYFSAGSGSGGCPPERSSLGLYVNLLQLIAVGEEEGIIWNKRC